MRKFYQHLEHHNEAKYSRWIISDFCQYHGYELFLILMFSKKPDINQQKILSQKSNDLNLQFCLHTCIKGKKNEENKIRRPDAIINKGGLAYKNISIS